MATYKVSYIEGDSYMKTGSVFVDNVFDEYEAVEIAIYKYGLPENIKINNVELVCE